MKLAFMSDLHLDCDAVVISGDISDGNSVQYDLQLLENQLQRKIYFVTGNHDVYNRSIKDMNEKLIVQHKNSSYLKYLNNISYEMITPSTAIVGHGCWSDARNGNVTGSSMLLTDWQAIKEFYDISAMTHRNARVELCRKLADEGVLHIHDGIKQAVRYANHIIVVAHPVPFEEAHIFCNRQGDFEAQPWFTCQSLGNMLLDASRAFPQINFTVLCGHTHGRCVLQKTKNLTVHVAGAEYYKPNIEKVFEF
jgi:predicted phosphohydrolase